MIKIEPISGAEELKTMTDLAAQIWQEYFTPIIGADQVNYMIEKFQSYDAVTKQLQDGYEYFSLFYCDSLVGYMGVQAGEHSLFLSKLYIQDTARGHGIARAAFDYLVTLCNERGLSTIWLTCNRYNTHTLEVYDHLGFVITEEKVADIGKGFVMDDYILEYNI